MSYNFTADEIMELLERVDSEFFGLNFDTGNLLRLPDDPVKGMEKLAPYVYATHLKDLMPYKIFFSAHDWFFFATVAVGMGLIDNENWQNILQKLDSKAKMLEYADEIAGQSIGLKFLELDFSDDE